MARSRVDSFIPTGDSELFLPPLTGDLVLGDYDPSFFPIVLGEELRSYFDLEPEANPILSAGF